LSICSAFSLACLFGFGKVGNVIARRNRAVRREYI
jgi:hypothetical protein